MINSYESVQGENTAEIVVERSKFIASCFEIKDEESAREFIALTRKKHSQATHNCYAYICSSDGRHFRFFDDGEPQGTAGQPILEVIKGKKLTNTLIIVTRYFGGIKLGTGGLVRAYSQAATEVLNGAKVIKYYLGAEFLLTLSYEGYSALSSYLKSNTITIIDSEYGENVSLKIAIIADNEAKVLQDMTDILSGKLKIERKSSGFFPL